VQPSAVIWAAGTSQDALGRVIDYQAQVNAYDAMVQAGVKRVVAVSSMGVWDKDSKGAAWFSEDDREWRGRGVCGECALPRLGG
jgi:nucleoside-diphosphate-sugar epimerase